MSLPAFISLPVNEQLSELCVYLNTKGAKLDEEVSPTNTPEQLVNVIQEIDKIWKESDDNDVEYVFNSLFSLVLYEPPEVLKTLVELLTEKLVKGNGERSATRLRILHNLFNGVEPEKRLAFEVYCGMLKLACKTKNCDGFPTDLDRVRKWSDLWKLNKDETHHLLKLLYDALQECKQSEASSKVMIELLGTYTTDNASKARDDAHRCIVNTLADPNIYLLDHLIALRPVKFLEGELIHDLLTIFVSGKLNDYLEFQNSNSDFIKSLGLSHEDNITKMRTLTLMTLAVEHKDLTFDLIEKEMQISEDEVEGFIIDAVRTKMVRAKIDQLQKKVVVSFATHRTFGKQQWMLLRERLEQWQRNLGQVTNGLDSLNTAMTQAAAQ
ncbi:eukaryotic translation initiation factor 3 subunit M-like [Anneissia japonica]|uniref:eukaryotic translation initiation factor 3 subunit M-like n=1 Tax=Anneissia japonica TaxID=1529436 RepID=UPI0014254C49|nr:eukaryotic translation initiation factor 3 subunit M-like [Anneissia japonica]